MANLGMKFRKLLSLGKSEKTGKNSAASSSNNKTSSKLRSKRTTTRVGVSNSSRISPSHQRRIDERRAEKRRELARKKRAESTVHDRNKLDRRERKTRERLTTLENTQIAFEIISEVLGQEDIIKPKYFANIYDEKDAQDSSDSLPLVYIWNEDRRRGTFNVSVNSLQVDELIHSRNVPMVASRFKKLRKFVMQELASLSRDTIVRSCEETGRFPSDLFPSK